MRSAPGAVLAICLAGLALAVVLAMGKEEARPSGTNLVNARGFNIDVPPGSELCQPLELVPADSASMLVFVVNAGPDSPQLAARVVAEDGETVAGSDVPGGYGHGALHVPLAPEVEEPTPATVCLQNAGDEVVGFGSGATPREQGAQVDGGLQPGRIRIEYFRPGSESWWALMPTVVHRFGLGKGDGLGSWTLWASGLILLLAIGLSARLVTR